MPTPFGKSNVGHLRGIRNLIALATTAAVLMIDEGWLEAAIIAMGCLLAAVPALLACYEEELRIVGLYNTLMWQAHDHFANADHEKAKGGHHRHVTEGMRLVRYCISKHPTLFLSADMLETPLNMMVPLPAELLNEVRRGNIQVSRCLHDMPPDVQTKYNIAV